VQQVSRTALKRSFVYTGVGKSRFTVVRMEKDLQVMIITIAKIDMIVWIQNNNSNNK
jgi:predicted P-loop ATPase